MKLPMSTVRELYLAHLHGLDGRQVGVLSDGKPNIDPYKLGADFRWQVEMNLIQMRPHIDSYDKAVAAKRQELRAAMRKKTTELEDAKASEDAIAKVMERMDRDAREQLEEQVSELLAKVVKVRGLQKFNWASFALDVNAIPHETMLCLSPLIDFAGRTLPKDDDEGDDEDNVVQMTAAG